MAKQMISIWEEHFFWLEILQDHAYFVRDYLSPSELDHVHVAQQYIHLFGNLLGMLNEINISTKATDKASIQFSERVWPVAKGYFEFEGKLQALRVDNKVNLNLSPTYLNGTLAENQEYLRLLSYWVKGKDPAPLPLVELMDLWLEDQLGHVLLFENILDPIEMNTMRQTEEYISKYQMFIVQNRHLRGYLRFKEPGFARQKQFAHEVGLTTIAMNQFIYEMVIKYKENRILNKTNLRFLEHHFPETCYFIKKLSDYAPELQETASKCPLKKPSYT